MTKQFANGSLYEIVDEGKKQVVLVAPYYLSDFSLPTSVVNPQTSEKYEVVGIKEGEKFTYFGLGFENVDVQYTDINGNDYSYVYFDEQDAKKEYLITTLNTKKDSVANASYTFNS